MQISQVLLFHHQGGHSRFQPRCLEANFHFTCLPIYKWDEWSQKTIKTPMTIWGNTINRKKSPDN